jgi:hypothetical protein
MKYSWFRPGLLESPSVLLLALEDVEERDGDDVTTIETPGDGDGFTEKVKKIYKLGNYLGDLVSSKV